MTHDVRMRGFQTRTAVAEVVELLRARVAALGAESVDLHHAAGRVLACDVVSDCPVPAFDRAAMDGYAVKAQETATATTNHPVQFVIIGEAFPARACALSVEGKQAIRIMTGAPIPSGADTVIPAENADAVGEHVHVKAPASPGHHVGKRGEDIEQGTTVLQAGRVLRPQDVGVLASIGASPVRVFRRPSAVILVTGDELLPAGAKPEGHRIVDSNSVMLEALLRRDAADAIRIEMIPDRRELIQQAFLQSKEDVILVSGGSSVGVEDHAPSILRELGELCVHGIAVRPASPTGLGFLGNRPVFLIPGNPVASLCAYDLFAGPAIRKLGGRRMDLPYPTCILTAGAEINSVIGRVEYARVRIEAGRVVPVGRSGASMLSSTTRADGFVLVPPERDGYREGEELQVYLYDQSTCS